MTANRNGLALTLGAIQAEHDHLAREFFGITSDHLARATDATLKHDLEEIKKHADRIANLCGAEIDRLVNRLNRHAMIAAE